MEVIELFNKKPQNQEINKFLEKIRLIKFDDEKIENFNNKINNFLSIYNIEKYDEFIHYNYLKFLYLYKFQKESSDGRSDKTLQEFLNVSLRILELYFFIENKNLKKLNRKFFSVKNFDVCLYNHFRAISNNITNRDINIEYLEDKSNRQIFLNEYFYKSSSMPVLHKNIGQNNTNFEQIFKIKNDQVNAVFSADLSTISNGKGGKGNLSKRKEIITHKSPSEDDYSNRYVPKDSSKETILDFQNSRIEKKSSIFHNYNITEKSILKYNINSSYKQHLINKAISNQLTKNSMSLKSTYNFPHFNQLKSLIAELSKYDDKDTFIILLSIYCGISIKNLIYSFLKIHPSLEYLSRNNEFRTEIPNDLYAGKKTDTVHFKLNDKLERIANILNDYYKNKKLHLTDENVEAFINEELENVKKRLSIVIKKLDKTIVLSIETLHKCLRFYFHQFNENSDVSILFHLNLHQSDKAKECYVQRPKRLNNLEIWMSNFYNLLNENNSNLKSFKEEESIGSQYFISANEFKKFIDDLDNLYIKTSDSIIKFNLQMIFIRYSLSLLLLTRDLKNSCSLANYSKRLKIITFQEKAKNFKTGKRIMPLCDLAIKLIDLFNITCKSYNYINQNVPYLNSDGKISEINTDNTLQFLKNICLDSEYEELSCFIKKCKLNAGRHIFSTLNRNNILKEEYEDEALGHFYLGKQGQGIYSNFDNQKFHSEIVKFMNEEIVNQYFPTKIFMLQE